MSDRRVVITGIGVVSPLGNDLPAYWEGLKAGRSGIGAIGAFDTGKFDCKIAGEVRGYDPTPFYKTPKDVRRTDRYTQFAVGAAKMALEDGGYDLAARGLRAVYRGRDRAGQGPPLTAALLAHAGAADLDRLLREVYLPRGKEWLAGFAPGGLRAAGRGGQLVTIARRAGAT